MLKDFNKNPIQPLNNPQALCKPFRPFNKHTHVVNRLRSPTLDVGDRFYIERLFSTRQFQERYQNSGSRLPIFMHLSIRHWRSRFSLILIGGLFLQGVLLLVCLFFVPGFKDSLSSPWPWLLAIPLLIGLLLYVRATHILDKVQEDLEKINVRTKRIAAGETELSKASPTIAITEVLRLNEEINAIARKAETDIADLKRLEQVRSEFLGNVSHELRTPIFSVQGYLETLLDGAIDDADVRDEFLEKAHNNMLRLHSLLNDLIEISRIESGAMKMSFRYFDLLAHCRTVVERLQATAEITDVAIKVEATGEDKEGKIIVLGDKKRLDQVLVNLIDNGIKYNRPGGEVLVSITADKQTVNVAVSNTGVGIPAEHLNRVFERFYRVDKGRSREVGGSGLGLAIVKHIVEAHGSSISVQSTPNVNTTFNFTLSKEA